MQMAEQSLHLVPPFALVMHRCQGLLADPGRRTHGDERAFEQGPVRMLKKARKVFKHTF